MEEEQTNPVSEEERESFITQTLGELQTRLDNAQRIRQDNPTTQFSPLRLEDTISNEQAERMAILIEKIKSAVIGDGSNPVRSPIGEFYRYVKGVYNIRVVNESDQNSLKALKGKALIFQAKRPKETTNFSVMPDGTFDLKVMFQNDNETKTPPYRAVETLKAMNLEEQKIADYFLNEALVQIQVGG